MCSLFFVINKGKKMNKLLLNESPLIILPSLASKIGLNEAIFVQQLHYWIQKSSTYFDNKKWVYKTTKEWENEFPFWSNSTIKRAINSLKKSRILMIKKVHPHVFYSINEANISGIKPKTEGQNELLIGQIDPSEGHNDPIKGQIDPTKVHFDPSKGQFDPSPIYNENQRDYTENTQKTTTENTHIFFMHEWNRFSDENNLRKISSLSESRKKRLIARLKSSDFKKLFNEALEEIKKSKYLLGEKGWKVGFDWLIKNDENILKVVEGNYQDKEQKKDYAESRLNNLPKAQNYVVEAW